MDNKAVMEKAKQAKTVEELYAIGKEIDSEFTEESAKAYFELLNPKTGELNDDELDNVAGGGCGKKDDGRPIVSSKYRCPKWFCCYDGVGGVKDNQQGCPNCNRFVECGTCRRSTYEHGVWICNEPTNRYKKLV